MASVRTASGVLDTKLNPPWHGNCIRRPRLIDDLVGAGRPPLVLISAPAGFGKSVLASQWAECIAGASAWISLDESDNELTVLLAHFVAGVHQVLPGALASLQETGDIAESPAPAAVARLLLNDLAQLDAPLTIVFDDYHVIDNQAVHDLFTQLVEQPAEQLCLVLTTRRDPPLPLSRLRGRGQLYEVRARELAFDRSEAREFLDAQLDDALDEESLEQLLFDTEGWPAGLRLAAAAARNRGPDRGPLRGVAPLDVGYIQDYLASEVLDQQPAAIRHGLLGTALLDRFCVSLYDAVMQPGGHSTTDDRSAVGGREFADWLVGSDLFVVPLDLDGVWYRYHPLFRGLLRSEFDRRNGSDLAADIYRRASAWCAESGLLDDAMTYALKVDDGFVTAAALADEHGYELIDQERWRVLLGWLAALPREVIDNDLDLLRLEAWTLGSGTHQFDQLVPTLDRAEQLVAEQQPSPELVERTLSCVAAMRGSMSYFSGQLAPAADELARAVPLLPRSEPRNLAWATMIRIMVVHSMGDRRHARELIDEARRDPRFAATGWTPSYMADVYVDWLELDLPALDRHAPVLLDWGETVRSPAEEGAALFYWGLVRYQLNLPDEAGEHLSRLLDAPTKYRPMELVHGAILLSLCGLANGDVQEAQRLGDFASLYASDLANSDFIPLTDAFQAELALRGGNLGRAIAWADQFDPVPMAQPLMGYDPIVTLVKVLLAEGSDVALRRADEVATGYSDFAEMTHNTPALVQSLGLQALVRAARDEPERADELLHRAVGIAEPGGAVRVLADLGSGLVPLLSRLDVHDVRLAYVAAVLGAMSGSHETVVGSSGDGPETRIDIGAGQVLTMRESQVLRLLAQRFSNKEIASELFISAATVKKHTVSLYQKLHVGSRREAVEKASAFGLLAD